MFKFSNSHYVQFLDKCICLTERKYKKNMFVSLVSVIFNILTNFVCLCLPPDRT